MASAFKTLASSRVASTFQAKDESTLHYNMISSKIGIKNFNLIVANEYNSILLTLSSCISKEFICKRY